MACDKWVAIKVLEVALCLTCMVYKRFSDLEELRQEKLYPDTNYLTRITLSEDGSIFADITYSAYAIICLGLLIGHITSGLVSAPMENFLLGLGVVMFGIAGSVVFVSLETALPGLKEYSAVLGVLSLVTALLFLLDIFTGSRRRKDYQARAKSAGKPAWLPTKATQTDVGQIVYDATKSVDLLGPAHRMSNGHVPSPPERGETGPQKPANGRVIENGHISSTRQHGQVPAASDLDNRDTDLQQSGKKSPPPPFVRSKSKTDDSILSQLRSALKGSSRNLEDPTFKTYSPTTSSKQRYLEPVFVSKSELPTQAISSGDEEEDLTRVPTVSFRDRKRAGAVQLLPMAPIDHSRLRPTPRPSDRDEPNTIGQRAVVMEIPDELGREIEAAYAVLDKNLVSKKTAEDQRDSGNVFRDRDGSKRSMFRTSAYLSLDPVEDAASRTQTDFDKRETEKSKLTSNGQYAQDIRELEEAITGKDWERFGSGRSQFGSRKKFSTSPPEESKMQSPLIDIKRETVRGNEYFPGDFPKDITKEVEAVLAERERQISESKRGMFAAKKSARKTFSDSEHGRRQRTVEFADPPSPDSDSDHWRYDSRDANLSRSSSRLDDRASPSSPQDPGFVLHTAHNWPDARMKTPIQTPQMSSDENEKNHGTHDVEKSPVRGRGRSLLVRKDSGPPTVVRLGPHPQDKDMDEDVPSSGSLTTQLLQRWFRQKQKVAKTKSGP